MRGSGAAGWRTTDEVPEVPTEQDVQPIAWSLEFSPRHEHVGLVSGLESEIDPLHGGPSALTPRATCRRPAQAAPIPARCGSKQTPSHSIAQATFSRRSATERRARACPWPRARSDRYLSWLTGSRWAATRVTSRTRWPARGVARTLSRVARSGIAHISRTAPCACVSSEGWPVQRERVVSYRRHADDCEGLRCLGRGA